MDASRLAIQRKDIAFRVADIQAAADNHGLCPTGCGAWVTERPLEFQARHISGS